jgi:Xaa-Pro dipeptidase
LYDVISTDSRFVVPNRQLRIGERSNAVRRGTSSVRARYDDRPLLLTTPGSVNWITGGLSDPVDITSPADPVWVVETSNARALITSEIEAPRLRGDFDLDALGWDLIAVPWYEANEPLVAACRFAGRSARDFISDREGIGASVVNDIVRARMVLTQPEQDELRELGSLAAFALESSIDRWRPGATTDFEIAAFVSAALERHGAKAVCLIVGGDNRLREYRHPIAIGESLGGAVMAVVVARRGGLNVAATRTAVTSENDPILSLTNEVELVHQEVLRATVPGSTWGDATEALAKGYENIGQPGAWREHFQGGPIAYEQREFELAPGQDDSPYWDSPCESGMAVAWNPSLRGGAKIEETYLLGTDGPTLVTNCQGWDLTPPGARPQHSVVKVVQ